MCLGLPAERTHRWRLQPAEQNAESTDTQTIWERQRSGERFHSHGEEWGVWCVEGQECACLCVRPSGGCSGRKVFVCFWGLGILKLMCSYGEGGGNKNKAIKRQQREMS